MANRRRGRHDIVLILIGVVQFTAWFVARRQLTAVTA